MGASGDVRRLSLRTWVVIAGLPRPDHDGAASRTQAYESLGYEIRPSVHLNGLDLLGSHELVNRLRDLIIERPDLHRAWFKLFAWSWGFTANPAHLDQLTVDRAPVALAVAGFVLEESAEWNPKEWHHYVLQLLPNGDCEIWLDGERLFVSPGVVTEAASLWVVLQGRSSHAPTLHDDVRVWEGIRYR